MNTAQVQFADYCDLFGRAELKAVLREGMFMPGAIQPDFHPDCETVYGNRFVAFVVGSFSKFPSHYSLIASVPFYTSDGVP